MAAIQGASVIATKADSKDGWSIVMNSFWDSKAVDSGGLFKLVAPPENSSFAIVVPEGNYKIIGWNIAANNYTVLNRLPMKVPFQVRAGEATYVGKINVLSVTGKNLLGMTVFGEGVIIIGDQYEKDVETISRTFHSVKRSQIRRSNVASLYANEMKRISDTPRKWLGYL